MKRIILVVFALISFNLYSQTFIDSVYSYKWGSGTQTIGRDEKFFPNNIFGNPTISASKHIPASAESDIVSLGFGGEIIVGNKDYYIIDKEGPDFIIFENVFSNYAETKVFVEPAIVSVSKDGINYIEFPYNSETLEGLAGVHWTNGDQDCFDYSVSGGDAFDLSTIGIDSIRYIKIKDTSKIASTLPNSNKYYSPEGVLSGFDLDAVALLHIAPIIEAIYDKKENIIYVSNVAGNYYLSYDEDINIKMFDILGYQKELKNSYIINKVDYIAGVYFIIATNKNNIQQIKIILQ
jgi:hypothetical protein